MCFTARSILSVAQSWIIGFLNQTVMKTSRKRTSKNIEEKSMSSQGDSHASLFPMQVRGGGQADARYLWPEMLRVIDEIRPTWVVGENVAGIATMVESCEITDMGSEASLFQEDNGVHRFRAEHTFTIERICRDLESKGYSVQPMLIPACAVGTHHERGRVYIIAFNENSNSHGWDRKSLAKERRSKNRRQRKPCSRSLQWFPTPEGTEVPIPCPGRFQIFSPICRANDGFPKGMDCEAIRAYGNAIVPQVMYRIFQCIEEAMYGNNQI